MKKTSSLVWRFFDRLEENKRCVAVLCKLCDSQYKYFGNTTNLRTHLVNKHPIQWELLQNGSLDESAYRVYDDDENTSQAAPTPKRRKYVKVYKNENVDVLENSETDIEQSANDGVETINLVQKHESRGSDEEWLEDDWTVDAYEPKRRKMKYRTIKREVTSPTPTKRSYLYNRKPSVVKQVSRTPQPGCITLDNNVKKDEFSVFGEYIGNKLRKFKSYQTSVNVQQLITTILWQAEYGVYDNMESVKRIVLSTVKEMDSTQDMGHDEIHVQTQELIIGDKDNDSNNQNDTDHVTIMEN